MLEDPPADPPGRFAAGGGDDRERRLAQRQQALDRRLTVARRAVQVIDQHDGTDLFHLQLRQAVGYGLEGALTDALSKVIIATAIAPQFQKGDFAGGIDAGVDAMLSILTGDAEEWQRRAEVREDSTTSLDPVLAFIMLLILFFLISRMMGAGRGRAVRRGRRGPWIVTPGGWSGGSGWSGGGGGFGGGGASGSW